MSILPHTLTAADTLREIHSTAQGISSKEAAARLAAHGPNEIQEAISRPPWKMLLAQFTEPMILLLVGAALVSAFLGQAVECVAILAIVVLFGILGFIQEYRAEKAIAALKQMSSPIVRVRRDGHWAEFPSKDLVPGDVVLLETGNIVPADLRLLETVQLGILESALTGESEAVEKDATSTFPADCPLGDRLNMAFSGTVVVKGRGEGVVVETGMRSELGKIAGMIQDIAPTATPLQQKLARVGMTISIAGGFAAAGVFVLGVLSGNEVGQMLLTGVSLAVAVIPEGLPAVITATLALGGRRMLKRNALIRKLPAVETLGAVTVICTDKTGTLTENKMTAIHVNTLHHQFDPRGDAVPAASRELHALLLAATLCNDGHILCDPGTHEYKCIGDPTETALLVAAAKLGLDVPALQAAHPRLGEYAFDSERKRMSTIHKPTPKEQRAAAYLAGEAETHFLAVKGSPDGLLALSTTLLSGDQAIPMTDDIRAQFLRANDELAEKGIRVLGFAMRRLPGTENPPTAEAAERELLFCGLIGLMDPPRVEVRAALKECREAGIRTIMITGDHPMTAAAIAKDLGLGPVKLSDAPDAIRVMSGTELAAVSDERLKTDVNGISVFARVSPEDKLRIVHALQANGHIVAMTGDGVNDSPALKKSEIGVAMGITGTDVAKASSEMILLDDHFDTIVAAVEEGRTIFDNLVRFIKYSFGGNLAKVLVMLLAPFCGITQLALLPLHLLWLNLLTDGLMGVGLGVEAGEPDVMKRPPRAPNAQILDRNALLHVGWMGIFIAFLSLLVTEAWEYSHPGGHWRTILFMCIGFAQIGQAWGLRAITGRPFRFAPNPTLLILSAATLILQCSVVYLPVLARIFKLHPLSPAELSGPILLGFITFTIVHLDRYRHARRNATR